MKKKIILTFMLSLLCVNKIYADCTQEEFDEFTRLENEYQVIYEFNKDTKDYNLVFTNPKPEMFDYIMYIKDDFNCNDIDKNITACYNVPINEYQIEIVGQTNTCNDVVKTFTLNLPRYNIFSEDPLCQGIEEFVLCQSTYDKQIDYETFVSRVNIYKKTKQKEIEKEENKELNEEDNKNINKIESYIKEKPIEVIIIAIFIILVVISIIVITRSIKKSRRLEW